VAGSSQYRHGIVAVEASAQHRGRIVAVSSRHRRSIAAASSLHRRSIVVASSQKHRKYVEVSSLHRLSLNDVVASSQHRGRAAHFDATACQ
jgi:hypothetical protein